MLSFVLWFWVFQSFFNYKTIFMVQKISHHWWLQDCTLHLQGILPFICSLTAFYVEFKLHTEICFFIIAISIMEVIYFERQPGDDEKMLFCDECDKGFHTYCLSPPMSSVPKTAWKCYVCPSVLLDSSFCFELLSFSVMISLHILMHGRVFCRNILSEYAFWFHSGFIRISLIFISSKTVCFVYLLG